VGGGRKGVVWGDGRVPFHGEGLEKASDRPERSVQIGAPISFIFENWRQPKFARLAHGCRHFSKMKVLSRF